MKSKISDINNLNVFKKNSKNNNMNAFKSKTINITRLSNPSSREKSHEKNLYDRFRIRSNINERYNYKNIPFKLMESKSNSKEKINKALKKFEKNINYSKQYCTTLNPKIEQKSKYLFLKTHSNSNEKNRSNRPATAILKNKNKKFSNDGFMIYNEKNFAEFTNFRDNLLSNNKKEKDNLNKKKFLAPNIHKNINPNNIFSKHNKLFIKTNNNVLFNNIANLENNNIFARTIYYNDKRIITPKIGMNHFLSESNRPKSGKKLKLSSALKLNGKKEK